MMFVRVKFICLCFLIVILVSCAQNSDSDIKLTLPNIIQNSNIAYSINDKVNIYLPAMRSKIDYSSWEVYFNDKYDTDINIKKYTFLDIDLESKALDSGNLLFSSFLAEFADKNIAKNGIFLFTMSEYQALYQVSINQLMLYKDIETNNSKFANDMLEWIGKPLNNLSFINEIDPKLLEPYTDIYGNIWAVPYEYKYPKVKVRKYNKDTLMQIGSSPPKTLSELYEVLIKSSDLSKANRILPNLNTDCVFDNFEDIVCAFNIKINPEKNAFFSIQYDEDTMEYIDIALDKRMADCIDYFTMLINSNLIGLNSNNDSLANIDNEFYLGRLFSTYSEIREEDLDIPFSEKLQHSNYTAHYYYTPSRYVYVLGRDLIVDSKVDDIFNCFYTIEEASLVSQFGIPDNEYNIDRNNYNKSTFSYEYSPKLIGDFYNNSLIQDSNELRNLKNQIISNNFRDEYYKELTPLMQALETNFLYTNIYEVSPNSNNETYYFVNLFYNMLSVHLGNIDRPLTEEFISKYRIEMKKRATSEIIKSYFVKGQVTSMNFKY